MLFVILSFMSGEKSASIHAGHDGEEYLEMAAAFRSLNLDAVPADARRHDPGWPLLIAFLSLFTESWVTSVLLTLVLVAASVFLYDRLLLQLEVPARQRRLMCAILSLGWPPLLYFSLFSLTEPLFIALMLAAIVLMKRTALTAYAIAGLLVLTRAAGVFLPATFAAIDLLRRRFRSAVSGIVTAALPSLLWLILVKAHWGETQVGVIRPEFSYPFSGMAGLAETGVLRTIYVVGVLAMTMLGATFLFRNSLRRDSPDILRRIAWFAGAFVLFHLLIRTMVYQGRPVYIADYLDRHLAVLLPLLLLPFARLIRPWHIAALVFVSIGASLYWGSNYLEARRQQISPVRANTPEAASTMLAVRELKR